MLTNLKTAFPQINKHSCLLSTNDKEIGIYDCNKDRVCKVQSVIGGLVQFKVENPKSKLIHILRIDGCMFFETDENKRCDFAVFDDKSFCFVELKLPLASRNRSKAKNQLIETIKFFKNKLIFTTKRIEAYASLGETIARPAQSAQSLQETVAFEKIGVQFYKGNVKKFQ